MTENAILTQILLTVLTAMSRFTLDVEIKSISALTLTNSSANFHKPLKFNHKTL